MKSLFDTETSQEIFERIEKLNQNTVAKWGQMDVAQMLSHCQKALDAVNGNLPLNTKISFPKKMILKLFKPLMYNDKPLRKNLDTTPEFKIVNAKDFESEKEKLISSINEFISKKDSANWPKHPLFGEFNTQQWGQSQYKHLNHHLTQFGV